jgi:dTDP-4-dehydrorhamnose reductase
VLGNAWARNHDPRLLAKRASGHELQRLGDVVALGRDQAIYRILQACADAIRTHAPRAVINAAAYTAVDKAEEEEALATIVNGDAPRQWRRPVQNWAFLWSISQPIMCLMERVRRLGSLMIPTAPQNAYGRSKLAGEIGIRTAVLCM